MNRGDTGKIFLAVGLIAVAIVLLLWQFAFKKDPNAVGVEDVPKEYRYSGGQRDPNAGPIPMDVSRRSPAPNQTPK
jgi:hypothetical protein